MYSFTTEKEKQIQEKAKALIGQNFKYTELCNILEIDKVSGKRNKEKQIRDLSNIIFLKEIPYGKQIKYLIVDVYDKPLLPWYDSDEWYSAFKVQVCSILKENNYSPVWFTRTPLLKSMGVVNDNFNVIMNDKTREWLSAIKQTSFENEYRCCKVIGDLLYDRVSDSLKKMTRERIIVYTNSYALRYKTKKDELRFISSQPTEEDSSLYQYLLELDNMAIDILLSTFYPNVIIRPDKRFTDRASFKAMHYYEVVEARNVLIQSEDFKNKIKDMGHDFQSLEGLFDVKYIIPDRRLSEEVIKQYPDAVRLLNQAAKKKVENSKDKTLRGFEIIKNGLIDICMELEPKEKYREEITIRKGLEDSLEDYKEKAFQKEEKKFEKKLMIQKACSAMLSANVPENYFDEQ